MTRLASRPASASTFGAWLLLGAVAAGCQGGESATPRSRASAIDATPPAPALAPEAVEEVKSQFSPERKDCSVVPVFADGRAAGSVCADDAHKHGLTVVDLSDAWTPRVFAADPTSGAAPEYREKYLDLAQQANADLGLYGVSPTLSLLATRLADEKRRACDEELDVRGLDQLRAAQYLAADERKAASLAKGVLGRPAVLAVQAQLACAGLLRSSQRSGSLSAATQAALDAFRRRHMVVGSGLDQETLRALALGNDELAFRGLLRGLRERVAEAAGLLEDGSASGNHALVVDRELDLSHFAALGLDPVAGGAPDLVDLAADAAARELGWTSAAAARQFIAALAPEAGLKTLRVAVALPPAPSYHSAAMELRVEIDRGDVFYETPGQAAIARKKLGEVRGASFVVYAKAGNEEHALVRWPTTIGGWQKERTDDGEIALKYKESDVGDRFWRQIIAAPAWMPPDSTPESELLREGKDGTFGLKRDLIQPGYRNAYGLVMLIHEEAVTNGSATKWLDHGIRTHGSVNYRSIKRGESHGCHRLYNQLALRLSGYLLDHRSHKRRGKMHTGYQRTLEYNEQTVEVAVPTRGYLYELDPPVPVRVLEGRIAGEKQKPTSSLIRLANSQRPQG